MPGLFNNETGLYEDVPWLRDGQWIEDEEEFLYIIPIQGAIAEIEGPDNATCDRLGELSEQFHGEPLSEALLTAMGLVEIPAVLKRFSPEEGYYHA